MSGDVGENPRITVRCTACAQWNRVRADKLRSGPKCGSCATGLPFDKPIQLNDETFERVISESGLPVYVDFYADWCGPCQMMAPAVQLLAQESLGRAVVAKLDTENAKAIAAKFQIRGIPTSIVFRGGRESKRHTGAMQLLSLRAMLA